MKHFLILFYIAISFACYSITAQAQEKQPIQIKLYAIDCGRIDISNFAEFSDTGDYDNKSLQLADPCFLIIHPKGNLLWDTGLPDSLVNKPKTAGQKSLMEILYYQVYLLRLQMRKHNPLP